MVALDFKASGALTTLTTTLQCTAVCSHIYTVNEITGVHFRPTTFFCGVCEQGYYYSNR